MEARKPVIIGSLSLAALFICIWLFSHPDISIEAELPETQEAIDRGEYLVIAGGCISCHRGTENEETLSGGFGIETDFGTFYAPNITPDIETGIGKWDAHDFLLALQHGRTPSGNYYYPAFPYRAYAGLKEQDVLDIGAYLMSLEPVYYQVQLPETPMWLTRWVVMGWNMLANFSQGEPEMFDDELIARGAYLARNLGHCGECHTPRNGLGIPDASREYAGAVLGEETIEAIDAEALKQWTANNFDLFLLMGMKPDGEFVGGDMNDVIEHNTSKLTDEDRDALAAYFTRNN
ncbi:MAG: cytochrome C [SAR86 cluster bacterium]|uniref:Cytochrome C n=1 Tax=SAR86 cluster bacterium TaxID=2030880 RepID=A0A2A5B133_9GAMM|nr:MAG: cytochrome C [SAR86 cluster bacterium]